MKNFDALCPTVTDSIDAEILGVPGARVRLIANFGAGYEHIDLAAARAAGLIVTNTPDVLTEATAELTMLLMLMVSRRAGEGERELRAGRWSGWRPTHLMGMSLSGKTLGLVGFGRIGRMVARLARQWLGMHITYHSSRAHYDDAGVQAEFLPSLGTLLARADVVSLHCPGGIGTHHLIGAEQLGLMKPTAILINTARGTVVDEVALAAALQAGTIAGAGLDVFENEPHVAKALLQAPNAVLLPHLGSATVEARSAMGLRVGENLDAFFGGGQPRDRVA
jgi:lactate dehydrogenase-like 2-hydroxyacid dehydrogenase